MSHQLFAARDRALCEDETRRTQRSSTPFDAGGCTGTLRFEWTEPTFSLAVCDECAFEVAVPKNVEPLRRAA